MVERARGIPAAMGDHLAARVVVRPHHLAKFFGIELAEQRRRVDQVAEQHRELSPLGVCGTWAARRPHQTLTVLADVVGMRVQQLGPDRVEPLVVQIEIFL